MASARCSLTLLCSGRSTCRVTAFQRLPQTSDTQRRRARKSQPTPIADFIRQMCTAQAAHFQERADLGFDVKNGRCKRGQCEQRRGPADRGLCRRLGRQLWVTIRGRKTKAAPAPAAATEQAARRAEVIEAGRGNLAEDVIEQRAGLTASRDIDRRSRSRWPLPTSRSTASPVDERSNAEALRDCACVDAFGQPQAHHQRFVGALRRMLSGSSSTMPWPLRASARQEILGLAVAHGAHARGAGRARRGRRRHNRRSASK